MDDETMQVLVFQILAIATGFCLTTQHVLYQLHKRKRDEPPGNAKTKRRRKYNKRPEYGKTTWGLMLKNNHETMVADPASREHRQFRLRFRVPYTLFLHLVKWTLTWYDKEVRPKDACGNKRVPVDLLVLGSLRMLGRGTCLDGINELSGISMGTMNKFSQKWCSRVRSDLYPKHVAFPTTDDDIAKAMSEFAWIGLPGAIASMDVVHVHWGMCPASSTVLHSGKEGFPTLAYQVMTDHSGKALACTAGFKGTINDKTIVKFDGCIRKLRAGSHAHVRYTMFDANGNEVQHTGVWVLVDGGYLKWPVTMAASSSFTCPGYAEWRKKMESVRKDIECYFGRMKARFRILKYPIELHKKTDVDNVFFTCDSTLGRGSRAPMVLIGVLLLDEIRK